MAQTSLPVLTPEGGLSRYLDEIRKFPMLEPKEEYTLAKDWREKNDVLIGHCERIGRNPAEIKRTAVWRFTG